jgi:RNA polymerase sigma-B factor
LSLLFGQETTRAQIGRELGYSQMRVSRPLARAVATLRAGLLAEN